LRIQLSGGRFFSAARSVCGEAVISGFVDQLDHEAPTFIPPDHSFPVDAKSRTTTELMAARPIDETIELLIRCPIGIHHPFSQFRSVAESSPPIAQGEPL
jgi:hypothetical protein